jgi:hypothetical protein
MEKVNLEDVKEVLQAITETVSKRERLQNPFEYNLTFEYKIEDKSTMELSSGLDMHKSNRVIMFWTSCKI